MKVFSAVILLCLASLIAAQPPCPPEEVIIGTECGKCPPGQTYNDYEKECIDCPPRTFKAEEGQGPCDDCPPHTFSSAGATTAAECKECPEGTVLLKNGECGTCPPGSYYSPYDADCVECYQNSFMPEDNIQESCYSCAGDSQSLPGATECIRCPSGKGLKADETCGTCPPGKYYTSYDFKCKFCYRNTFMPVENIRSDCYDCAGDSSSTKGATECVKCPSGKVLMRDGKCRVCPKGSGYERGRLNCRKCGFNNYSKGKGIRQSCQLCPNSWYANKGSTKCFQCPSKTALIQIKKSARGKCGRCLPGTYYDKYDAVCRECYGESASPGGIGTDCTYCENGTNEDKSECL